MRLIIGTATLAFITAACGGDDSTNIVLPDSGNPDTAVLVDSAALPDSSGDASVDSTAPDTSVPPDAGNFQVGKVFGLALWLDAAKGIKGNKNSVLTWDDQSGNSNNAMQQNTNWQPKLVSNAIDNLPAVHFKANAGGNGGSYGNFMGIASSPTLSWGTGDFLIEVVAQYDNTTQQVPQAQVQVGAGTFYSKQDYQQVPLQPLGGGVGFYGNYPGSGSVLPSTGFAGFTDQTNFLASNVTGYNDGKPHLFAVQRVGTTLNLREGGAQTDTKMVAAVNVDNKNAMARIGASGDATIYRLNGDIAEMIAVKGQISAQDLSGIETYLKVKYGL